LINTELVRTENKLYGLIFQVIVLNNIVCTYTYYIILTKNNIRRWYHQILMVSSNGIPML
jgi:hypothetical protein